jgi:F-type H+-transporting ATPase subunit b
MEVGSMGHATPHGSRFYGTVLSVVGILTFDFIPSVLASSEGGGVTVVPDWSVGIQIVNFLFLIFVLNLLLFRPIRKILKERREKIKGMESAIENAGNSVQEKNAAFDKAIRDARARGLKEKEALVKRAEEEERRQIESINSKAQTELEEIRRKISSDAERARQALQPQVGAFAKEITQKILGRAVS